MLKIKKNHNKIEITTSKKAKRFTPDFWKGLLIALACHLVFLALFQVVSLPSENKPFLPFTKVIADPTFTQSAHNQEHRTFPTWETDLELPPLATPTLCFPRPLFSFPEPDFSQLEKIEYQLAEGDDDV